MNRTGKKLFPKTFNTDFLKIGVVCSIDDSISPVIRVDNSDSVGRSNGIFTASQLSEYRYDSDFSSGLII